MRRESYQQFAIVAADSAQSLTEQLNAKLRELADKHPTVTFDGMIARIQYEISVPVPESIEAEYELQGVNLTCQDCPFFEPARNKNGSVDRRAKWGGCRFAEYGMASRDARVCEKLFQLINNGEVRLCVDTIE